MKRILVALLFCATATTLHAADPVFTIEVNSSLTIPMFGVTAAWAIDTSIVDVALQQGNVILFGRASGRTQLVVFGVTGQHSYDLIITARPGLATLTPQSTSAGNGSAEVRYSTAARELQGTVTVAREEKNKRTEAGIRTIYHPAEPIGDRAKTSIATAYYRLFTRGHELTLFDRDVDHSPLTLEATPLRGIHYLDSHWRLHAGYTAYASYRSFLIPVDRQLVVGGGYALRATQRSTFTPTFFAYPGKGSVASLLYDYQDGDRLAMRGEVGYSNGLGAAGEIAYHDDNDRVQASIRYRPDSFAVASTATPRGFFGDASWAHTYGRGSTASMSWAATDIGDSRVISGSGNVDHRLNDRLTLLGGASWATFDGTRTFTIPAGVQVDFAHGGATAIYRYSQSQDNDGGHGLRLSARASIGRFYASAYADRQQNAPTLEFIFSERPDLALALTELGIVATSPSDIARALREHSILAELGFIDGVTLELAPTRTQFGLEAAWLSTGPRRQQLRARLLRSDVETVSSNRTTTIATLTYAQRLTGATDIFASYSYWHTDHGSEPFAEIGIRQRFDGLPSMLAGKGTISGVVFVDEDMDGRSDGTGVAAEVELDALTKQRTNADGSFAFNGIPRGTHRVVARIPNKPEAYFTTPSRVETETGEKIAFGVATSPARLIGVLKDDAGAGIAGVRVLLGRGPNQLFATTTSDGGFTIAAPPGEWQLSILTDSIPAGYALSGIETRSVTLDRAQPLHTEQILRAHRTISGHTTPHADVIARVAAPFEAKQVRADEQGQFSIRSLPSGTVTLVSRGVARTVELPPGPAALTVDFTSQPEIAAAVKTEVHGERHEQMTGLVVQLGAYRIRANADITMKSARNAGVATTLEMSGSLMFVLAGPYNSRELATQTATRLTNAGIDAVVLTRK